MDQARVMGEGGREGKGRARRAPHSFLLTTIGPVAARGAGAATTP
jgi:hypothetical protein